MLLLLSTYPCRRHLERQNVEEEAQVRRLLGAMAAERARDAGLVVTLEAKQEEMKVRGQVCAWGGSGLLVLRPHPMSSCYFSLTSVTLHGPMPGRRPS